MAPIPVVRAPRPECRRATLTNSGIVLKQGAPFPYVVPGSPVHVLRKHLEWAQTQPRIWIHKTTDQCHT